MIIMQFLKLIFMSVKQVVCNICENLTNHKLPVIIQSLTYTLMPKYPISTCIYYCKMLVANF